MPIEQYYLEAGIIQVNWIGEVHIADVIKRSDETIEMLESAGDQRCVLIMNLTDCTKIPFNISPLKNLVDTTFKHAAGIVVVNPPRLGQILMDVMFKLTRRPLIAVSDMDQAVDTARNLLKDES